MAYKFSGSGTATIAGTAGIRVSNVSDKDGDGKINVTTAGDATYVYEADIDDPAISFDALGADAIDRGDTGATTFSWNDGGSTSLGTSVVVGKEKSGSIGEKIVYKLTVVPAAA